MQDTSRQFLNSNKPSKKYALFLKATQLEQLKLNLDEAIENRNTLMENMASKKEKLPLMLHKVKVLEQEYKDLSKIEESKKTLRELKNTLGWSYVFETEDKLENEQRKLDALEDEVNKVAKAKIPLEAKVSEIKEKINNARENANHSRAEELNAQILHIESKINTVRLNIDQKKNQIKARKDDIRLLEKRCASKQENINKRQAQNTEQEERVKKENEKACEVKEKEASVLADKLVEYEKKKRELELQKEELDSTARYKEQDLRRISDDLNSLMMKAEKNEAMIMEKVIEKNKEHFKQTPLGPIVRYISLKEEKWKYPVSTICKPYANNYIIFNKEDVKTFNELAIKQNIKPSPSTILMEYGSNRYDISHRKLKYLTILDVLEISKNEVFNAVCDWCSIYMRVLSENLDEALKMIKYPDVKDISTLDGYRVQSSGGAETTSYISNKEDIFDSIDKKLSLKQTELSVLESECRENKAHIAKLAEEIEHFRKRCVHTNRLIENLRQEIKDIKRLIYNQTSQKDESIVELEKYIEQDRLKIKERQQHIQELERDIELLENEQSQIREELEETKRLKAKENATIETFAKEIGKFKENLTKYSMKIKEYDHKTSQCQDHIAVIKSQIAALEAKLKEDIPKAETLSSRPEQRSSDPPNKIIYKIQRLQTHLEEQQENKRTLEQAFRDYQMKKKQYDQLCALLHEMERSSILLQDCIISRRRKWKKFLKSISMRTNLLFVGYLSQKGFKGSLEFDHNAGHLNIHISPESNNDKRIPNADTSTLSGGERSFSTVCLLLSLWDIMESPFKAMDEFDVFMDPVNRRISTELIIKAARDRGNMQYIFLTPHDLGPIPIDDDIKILRMGTPERN